jgi:hypothetical protein
MGDEYTHWLQQQLTVEFGQEQIAETGTRIMDAISPRSDGGVKRYEYALLMTLAALRTRRDGHPPIDWIGGPPDFGPHLTSVLLEPEAA